MADFYETDSWRTSLHFEQGGDLTEGLRRISSLLGEMDIFLASVPGLPPEGASGLRLVCDEIGANVVRHSSPEQSTLLEVLIETGVRSIRMRITDNGTPFNPFDQPVPYLGTDLDKRRVGGLGLHLIRQIFPDAVYCRRDGCNISEIEYAFGGRTRKETSVFGSSKGMREE